jgi:5'-nucleotidase
MQRRTPALVLAAALSLGALAACGSSGGSDSSGTTVPKPDKTTTTAAADPLRILVSNDDGYNAPGIDALVEGLQTLDGVEITVVAPLEQQSGTGGKTTDGDVAVTDVKTAGGYPAKAVDGYPSDSVRVAFEDLDADPQLVITGINSIQNIGAGIDESGTVGAAREGVAQGVPALATSQGNGETIDYPAGLPFILGWVNAHREALVAGDEPVQVTNLNVPSCDTGRIRGLLEVTPDPNADLAAGLQKQDCTSTTPKAELTTDVPAFDAGFATIGVVPSTPGG